MRRVNIDLVMSPAEMRNLANIMEEDIAGLPGCKASVRVNWYHSSVTFFNSESAEIRADIEKPYDGHPLVPIELLVNCLGADESDWTVARAVYSLCSSLSSLSRLSALQAAP